MLAFSNVLNLVKNEVTQALHSKSYLKSYKNKT